MKSKGRRWSRRKTAEYSVNEWQEQSQQRRDVRIISGRLTINKGCLYNKGVHTCRFQLQSWVSDIFGPNTGTIDEKALLLAKRFQRTLWDTMIHASPFTMKLLQDIWMVVQPQDRHVRVLQRRRHDQKEDGLLSWTNFKQRGIETPKYKV